MLLVLKGEQLPEQPSNEAERIFGYFRHPARSRTTQLSPMNFQHKYQRQTIRLLVVGVFESQTFDSAASITRQIKSKSLHTNSQLQIQTLQTCNAPR